LVRILEETSAQSLPAAEIELAIRTHFAHERERIDRQLRQQRRFGQIALAVGLSVLIAFLTLAQVAHHLPEGAAREVVREGLVITGWVAMWRPIEVLLYDWWPLAQARKQIARILAAQVEVRFRT
jgi:hypothetical protein